MKIRVIKNFNDKMFGNKLLRLEGTVIDTDNPNEKCSEELAKERIKLGVCVEYDELPLEEAPKKGKKANKK